MQYTAKKPFNSVLIIQPTGLRYRLQEDHVFKEIRYAQVTGVKLKKDHFRFYFGYIIAPLMITGHFFIIQEQGLNYINGINLIFCGAVLGLHFFFKQVYTISIDKGPLTAEVYMTEKLVEGRKIKKEIESHL